MFRNNSRFVDFQHTLLTVDSRTHIQTHIQWKVYFPNGISNENHKIIFQNPDKFAANV